MDQKIFIRHMLLEPLLPESIENRRIRERELSRTGRELVLNLIHEQWGIEGKLTDFETGPHGKPWLRSCPNLFFNISHSNHLVIAAVSEQPVGIDVEAIRVQGRTDPQKLAERSFPPSFLRRMGEASDPETEFFWLWTELEAYGKYLGTGLPGVLRREPSEGVGWRLPTPEGYAGCLWTRETCESVSIQLSRESPASTGGGL